MVDVDLLGTLSPDPRPYLYGLGHPRQPSPGDNFTEHLYDKKLAQPTKIKLTLLNYSKILL